MQAYNIEHIHFLEALQHADIAHASCRVALGIVSITMVMPESLSTEFQSHKKS